MTGAMTDLKRCRLCSRIATATLDFTTYENNKQLSPTEPEDYCDEHLEAISTKYLRQRVWTNTTRHYSHQHLADLAQANAQSNRIMERLHAFETENPLPWEKSA